MLSGGLRRCARRRPGPAGGVAARQVAGLHGERGTTRSGIQIKGSGWGGYNGYFLGAGVVAAGVGGDELYGIHAVLSVAVSRLRFGAGAAVAEVPGVANGIEAVVGQAESGFPQGIGGGKCRLRQASYVHGDGFGARPGGIAGFQGDGVRARCGKGKAGILLSGGFRRRARRRPGPVGGVAARQVAGLCGERRTAGGGIQFKRSGGGGDHLHLLRQGVVIAGIEGNEGYRKNAI